MVTLVIFKKKNFRVIFETVRSSYTQDLLPNFMIQQIAGRAGRYGSSYPDGKVYLILLL